MAHNHGEHIALSGRALKYTLIITLGIMVVEIIGGILSNSLALFSDAGHMLVDNLAIGVSLFAVMMVTRPPTSTRTYGYHRLEIMAALINGATLIVVAIVIFYEAYQRFLSPPNVKSPIMLAVAVIGLVANFAGVFILRRASKSSLNIKAAFWHIIGDTISSVGVVVAALVIMFTGFYMIDPIIAVVIGIIILFGAVPIIRESADVLLESVPRDIKIERVIEALKKVPGVEDVHDIHIWTITTNINALSAHLVLNDQMLSKSSEVIRAVDADMEKNFNIAHTTLQLECQACTTSCACDIKRIEAEHVQTNRS